MLRRANLALGYSITGEPRDRNILTATTRLSAPSRAEPDTRLSETRHWAPRSLAGLFAVLPVGDRTRRDPTSVLLGIAPG
jgi:hypothetical protein